MKSLKQLPFKTDPLPTMKGEYTHTKDDIHDSIRLCPVIKTLLATPYMQRLRDLKQLGVTHLIYTNANHTRFEHSLGVAHLAETMAKVIQTRQAQLGVSHKDILCVKIAGLLHDLGHGPYSHVFDGPFQSQIKKSNNQYVKVKHEITSLKLIDATLKCLGLKIDTKNLDEPLEQIGDGIAAEKFGVCNSHYDPQRPLPPEYVFTSRDWIFIKECILGEPLPGNANYMGRTKEKEFLYDIVSNRHNGLDVDKIDYYARDEKRALGKGGGLFIMFINEAFVAKATCPQPNKCFQCKNKQDPQHHYMISYPEKLVTNAMEFFKTRFRLHSTVYTHKTKPGELLICQILAAADPHYRILNGSDLPVRISEAVHHPEAFLNLRDGIIQTLRMSSFDNNQICHLLIDRFRKRDLFKCAITLPIENKPDHESIWKMEEEDIEYELIHEIEGKHRSTESNNVIELSANDVIVEKKTIHHGMKEQNPVNLMRFLPKHKLSNLDTSAENLPEAIQIDEARYESHIPRSFQERTICVYSRNKEKRDLVKHKFSAFLLRKEYDDKPEMSGFEAYESPVKEDDEEASYERLPILSQDSIHHDDGESNSKVASAVKPSKRNRPGEDDDFPHDTIKSRKLQNKNGSSKVKKALAFL